MPFTGYWSLVVPEESVNYVKNPSFEKDLTGWSSNGAGSGTATRSDEWQFRGIYSLKLVKTVSANQWGYQYSVPDYADFASGYATVSVRYKVVSGTLNIEVAGSGASPVTESVTGEGEVSLTIGPLSAGITSLTVTSYFSASTTGTAYVDAVLVENSNSGSTYFDGDSQGSYWQGIIHGSKSTLTTKNSLGGKIHDLADYQVAVESSSGMGMPSIDLQTQQQSLFPGSLLRGYNVKERSVTLNCTIVIENGQTRQSVHSLRKDLIDLTKPDKYGAYTPFLLKYDGANLTQSIFLPVIYDSGLEFNPLDGFSEIINFRLISPSVFWFTFKETAYALSRGTTASDLSGMAVKDNTTTWDRKTVLGTVYDYAEDPNGKVYVGGDFTSAGGVGSTAYLALWDPESDSFQSVGVLNGRVSTISIDSNGDVYVGGTFTSAGGISNTQYIARYIPSSGVWQSITPSGVANGNLTSIDIDRQGNLYATGSFTSIDTVSASRIAKYDISSSTWSALSTGLNSTGYMLDIDSEDNVYIVGVFTTAGGVTVNMVTKWNGSSFEAFSDGVIGITGTVVNCVMVHSDGSIYIGGTFTAAGSISVNNIVNWNGLQFTPLNSGTNGKVSNLLELSDGSILAMGNFNNTGGLEFSLSSRIARWDGYVWLPIDIIIDHSSYYCLDALIHSNGTILIGGGINNSTGTVPDITSIQVDSTSKIYPKFRIERLSGSGTAIVKWIENKTNDKRLLLDYDLQEGEILTIDLQPNKRQIQSSVFGLVWSAILPTSDVGTFCFQPGSNSVSVMIAITSSASVSVYAITPTQHWSLDGVAL